MLAADAELEVLASRAALLARHVDQLTDARRVERLERVDHQDFLRQVVGQEGIDVVAAEAERHLREVVGAEAEEVRLLGDFVGRQRRTRNFDHRADQDIELGRTSFRP